MGWEVGGGKYGLRGGGGMDDWMGWSGRAKTPRSSSYDDGLHTRTPCYLDLIANCPVAAELSSNSSAPAGLVVVVVRQGREVPAQRVVITCSPSRFAPGFRLAGWLAQ